MKRIVTLTAILALAVLPQAAGAGVRAKAPKIPTLTFLLAGQSNMAGYGPASTDRANLRVLAYNGAGFSPAAEPLLGGGGSGLALSFGDALAAQLHVRVKLIPCAVGSTSIEQWLPADGPLFSTCMARAAHSRIDGILWMQGESDTSRVDVAAMWGEHFATLVKEMRFAFGDVPVVFGQIGTWDSADAPGWQVVKTQQAEVAIPHTVMVRSDDLAQQDASMHFTTPSYRTLGERFASAWVRLAS